MNEQENRRDQYLKSLFQESEVKHHLGITEKVMAKIQESPAAKQHTYEPPITRLGWICIFCMLLGLILVTTAMNTSFSVQLPDMTPQFSLGIDQLRRLLNWNISLPAMPKLSMPLLAAILLFNVAGMYFVVTYRRTRRA